jgi:hypothetical protein
MINIFIAENKEETVKEGNFIGKDLNFRLLPPQLPAVRFLRFFMSV